jgi:hypothetical protein
VHERPTRRWAVAVVALIAASLLAFVGARTTTMRRATPDLEAAAHGGVAVPPAGMGGISRAEARAVAPLAPAPGWTGEIKLGAEDTWEPTIAADPSGPYLRGVQRLQST